MKNKILFIFILLAFNSTITISQVQQWSKYVQNPVMVKQNFLTEFYAIGQPAVIMENDTFKMWYVACGLDHKGRVLYARSTNGITWTKYGNGAAVMDVGTVGAWDDTWLDTPEILHGPGGYFLYFFGDSVTNQQPNPSVSTTSALGVATSLDGIHWTRFAGNPILTKGDTNSWENFWIESPAVLWDSATNQYMMWYSGVNKNWLIQTGLATSPDGLNWTKYPGNPVITHGLAGSYDDMWVAVPSVIKRNNQFEMWYNAFNSISAYDTLYICYATSPDGINWTKFAGNPLFNTYTAPSDTNIDKSGPWACDVVYDAKENNYKMWYETKAGFCFATSPVSTGITNKTLNDNFHFEIFPNPANDKIVIDIKNFNLSENFDIDIYSIDGRLLFQQKAVKGKNEIDIHYLSNGIYFLKLNNEKYSEVKPVVKF
ncbi:MAG: T9SS type A sorting domain-containing protein [Bacteroidales bacterium]|jgi:predicted GH43/DUF377 family glycosyl hydrolase